MFVSGYIAAMAVDWYHISSREGASGYFVLALGILGFGAGLVIGLVVARLVAAGAHPGFLRALGISLALVAGLGVLSGGLTRLLADVPPTLDGETLMLAVEVRWPADRKEAPSAVGPDEPSLSLHSIPRFSRTVRATQSGPLWMEDAHLVDGRWVVPGAVEVFTSRGTRMLSVNTGEKDTQGFQVPLRAFPGKKDLEWSDWLPKFRSGVSVPANLLSYRYQVRKGSQPIRTETVGPFEITTSAYGFHEEQRDQHTVFVTGASYGFRYRGEPLVIEGKTSATGDATRRFDRVDDVALVAGSRPSLLIHVDPPDGSGYCYLVSGADQRARIEFVAECGGPTKGEALTSDTALFHAAARGQPVRGRIDRVSYARPGLYRIGSAVVDTRELAVHRFTPDTTVYNIPAVRPLALSPDERSFVTFANPSGTTPQPVLLVTEFVDNRTYALPIDPARMRYPKLESLDPAWLDHHFEWQRMRGEADRLVERRHFVPLAYYGEITTESDGHRTYRLEKGTEGLRGALIEFLVKEFKAERQPADSGAYEVPVTIEGHRVMVAFSSDFGYVAVSLARGGAEDPALVTRIGERFDAALATGRYDNLFTN